MNAAAAFFASPASRQRIAAQPSGRDHGVDRVLLHQYAVGDRDRDSAAGAALADDAGDGRNGQPRHHRLRAGDRAALPVLLGGDPRIGAGRVDERHEREPEPLRDLHHAHRLHVALGVGHPELAVDALLDVAALLVPDEHDRPAVELPDARDERAVVGAAAVAVQLDPVVDETRDVVERVRPIRVARELDRPPDRLVGRLVLQAVELALAGGPPRPNARAAQQRQP